VHAKGEGPVFLQAVHTLPVQSNSYMKIHTYCPFSWNKIRENNFVFEGDRNSYGFQTTWILDDRNSRWELVEFLVKNCMWLFWLACFDMTAHYVWNRVW